jgi:hypothetical protein
MGQWLTPKTETVGSPEGDLVAAILARAMLDARSDGPDRDDARAFLQDASRLGFWCDMVGLDAEVVHTLVRRVLADSKGGEL